MRRLLVVLVLGCLAGLWEIAIGPFLPSWASIHFLLPVSILILIGSDRTKALVFVCVGALLIDVYAISTVDFAFIRVALLILFLDFLLRQWLTNRSLYVAIGLVCVARLIDQGLYWLFGSVVSLFSSTLYGFPSFRLSVSTFVWDILIVAVGFLVLAAFTRRLSSLFHRSSRGETYGTLE